MDIFLNAKKGERTGAIAARLGMSAASISGIKHGKDWKHVTKNL